MHTVNIVSQAYICVIVSSQVKASHLSYSHGTYRLKKHKTVSNEAVTVHAVGVMCCFQANFLQNCFMFTFVHHISLFGDLPTVCCHFVPFSCFVLFFYIWAHFMSIFLCLMCLFVHFLSLWDCFAPQWSFCAFLASSVACSCYVYSYRGSGPGTIWPKSHLGLCLVGNPSMVKGLNTSNRSYSLWLFDIFVIFCRLSYLGLCLVGQFSNLSKNILYTTKAKSPSPCSFSLFYKIIIRVLI